MHGMGCMAADESMIGPFRDRKDNFTHLIKSEIVLLVWWVDKDGDKFRNSDVISFSTQDSLFEILTQRIDLTLWGQLRTVRCGGADGEIDIQMNLYRNHGKVFFDKNPTGYYRGAKSAVDDMQKYIEAHPSAVRCTFILDELPLHERSNLQKLLDDLKSKLVEL
jgi:hypothetical protein